MMNLATTARIRPAPAAKRAALPWLLLLALVGASGSRSALAAALEDISYSALPGDRVELSIRLSEPLAADPLSFTVDNPARIALDFPDTALRIAARAQSIGVGRVEGITAVEAGGRTRVVVNLVSAVPYSLKREGNLLKVLLDSSPADLSVATGSESLAAQAQASGEQPPAAAGEVTLPGSAKGESIRGVDFKRGELGQALIMVDLSNPRVGIDIKEEAGKLVVDFMDTKLPPSLDRKLDVTDFATPAMEVDTSPLGNGTRMIVSASGTYEHLAYQTDNLFTLELKPLTKQQEEQSKREKFGYVGEKLSLNFQDIDVRAVLQLIADFSGFNLIASDTVTGSVTLRLKNTPWDQAMDLILRTKGLAKRQTGNVIMVAPHEEIATREKQELEAQKALVELSPLRTEFVQINYAKAEDIAGLIKAKENNLLSGRGSVTVDARTNTLLIQDTAENLTDIRKAVAALDVPVRQVLIESRIVIANEDFSRDLGVRFGYSKNSNQNQNRVNRIGGGLAGDVDYGGQTGFAVDGVENYMVNLPVANPAGAFRWSIGKVGSYLLQLELSALQTEGRGEVIASPQVITANQKEALIESGTEIPYQQASSSGATNVEFKKAVLSLKVTPQITPDDRIIMDLIVNNDSVGQIFAGVPSIDTKQVNTQVLVDNGETVVLGGIFTSTSKTDRSSVPFFGDVPYVGAMFRSRSVENTKKELLIFVTPKILKEGLAVSKR